MATPAQAQAAMELDAALRATADANRAWAKAAESWWQAWFAMFDRREV